MSSVSLIDGHIDEPRMTTEKAIKMIDEYLLEPNSIHRDWVECLQLCREALVKNDRQKAEIEKLNIAFDACKKEYDDMFEIAKNQKAEIDILIRKKETLRDEIAEQQAEIERLHERIAKQTL